MMTHFSRKIANIRNPQPEAKSGSSFYPNYCLTADSLPLAFAFGVTFLGFAALFLHCMRKLELISGVTMDASEAIRRLFSFTAAGWLVLTAALFGFFRWKLLSFMNHIYDSIKAMADGTFIQTSPKDTLLSQFTAELSRLYDILEHAREDALAKQKQLQQLLSDISHQAKTPAANLRLISDAVSQPGATKEDTAFFLKLFQEQTEKLIFLMTALEKCSRLETGMIVMKPKNCCLYTLLEKTASQISPAALRKNIDIAIVCDPELTIPVDRKWTAECIFNFLDNAVKYTAPGGHICIHAQPMESYVRIDVADNGRGIPEAEIPHIFKRFYREDAVSEQPGIGMGLYIARKIISMQGGYIHTTSCPGRGSIFSVCLPKITPRS